MNLVDAIKGAASADAESDEEVSEIEEEPSKENNETKAERFVRVAEPRISKVLERIDMLDPLADSSRYEYSPEQVEKMFGAIEERLAIVKGHFSERPDPETTSFSF